MELFEINPFVRFAQRRDYIPKYTDFVVTYDHRLFYSCSDTIEIVFEDFSFLVKENHFALIPPATKYKLSKTSNPDYVVLNFDMDFCSFHQQSFVSPCSPDDFEYESILSKNLYNTSPVLLSGSSNAKKMLAEICDAFTRKSLHYIEKNSALLKSVIVESIIATGLDKTPKIVDDIKKFIDENYSKNISNEEIGNAFGYHPNHLNRLFKTHTKMSLHQFIIDTRLTKSVDIINDSTLSITQIGELCGFSSTPYFIKKFKEKYNLSPLSFRKQKYEKT